MAEQTRKAKPFQSVRNFVFHLFTADSLQQNRRELQGKGKRKRKRGLFQVFNVISNKTDKVGNSILKRT